MGGGEGWMRSMCEALTTGAGAGLMRWAGIPAWNWCMDNGVTQLRVKRHFDAAGTELCLWGHGNMCVAVLCCLLHVVVSCWCCRVLDANIKGERISWLRRDQASFQVQNLDRVVHSHGRSIQ